MPNFQSAGEKLVRLMPDELISHWSHMAHPYGGVYLYQRHQ